MNKHISILIQSHFDDSFCYLYLIEMGKLSDNVLPVDAAVTVCLGILLRLPKSGDQYPFFFIWESVASITIILFRKIISLERTKKWKHCSSFRSNILLLNFNNRTVYIRVYVCILCVQAGISNTLAKDTREKYGSWNAYKVVPTPNWMIEETLFCIWEPNMVNHNSRPIWSGTGKGQQQRHCSRVIRKGNGYHQAGIRGLWKLHNLWGIYTSLSSLNNVHIVCLNRAVSHACTLPEV